MRRWVFTIVSALSLVLCVGTCVLWVRSVVAADVLWGDKAIAIAPATIDRRMFTVESGGGGVLLQAGRVVTADPRIRAGPPTGRWVVQSRGGTAVPVRQGLRYKWLGFGWDPSGSTTALTTYWGVRLVIPYWFVALCVAIPAMAWVRRRLALPRRRAARGECPRCGYDLRATPDRCPECGAVPAAR